LHPSVFVPKDKDHALFVFSAFVVLIKGEEKFWTIGWILVVEFVKMEI
jgi:hypothetical protein